MKKEKKDDKHKQPKASIKPKGKELTDKELDKASGGSFSWGVSSGGDRPTES